MKNSPTEPGASASGYAERSGANSLGPLGRSLVEQYRRQAMTACAALDSASFREGDVWLVQRGKATITSERVFAWLPL